MKMKSADALVSPANRVLKLLTTLLVVSSAMLWSCSSPLDINTIRKQTSSLPTPLVAKYINMVFEGGDILGVQDGCELSWYAGLTDSIHIDTSGRVSAIRLYASDVKVKNVLLGKYYLQTMSIRFDSLACSNLSTVITKGMSAANGAEMTVSYGQQTMNFTADGVKTKVYVTATEHRPARMVQCRFAVQMADPFNPAAKLNYNVRATIIY